MKINHYLPTFKQLLISVCFIEKQYADNCCISDKYVHICSIFEKVTVIKRVILH